ncbi:hypothetical protein HanXRQr2_Chr09g0370971 [Helianthus annuus]|uniref:Uncharacterized protein n=1 Tax=Helianthus annuus TaxID=4232 RepID=A0A9K3I392_HELAN|nr:hypothetical protein HanXRQr2_Chr09g0370971 [Helianthus annuus]KAJ0891722.1 hypothetical protein HanPSC8_Chr09g0357391 [Helianthus annuus]
MFVVNTLKTYYFVQPAKFAGISTSHQYMFYMLTGFYFSFSLYMIQFLCQGSVHKKEMWQPTAVIIYILERSRAFP